MNPSRRSVLGGLAATFAPGAVRAEPRPGMRRLAVLIVGVEDNPISPVEQAAVRQGLGAHGWVEGTNLDIAWRWSMFAGMEQAVDELVSLRPDLLLGSGNTVVEAAQARKVTLPVVFTLVSDPVGMGYVASLAHPGGNITGFSSYDPPIYTKQLQLLTEIDPPARTVAVLYNPDTAHYAAEMLRATEGAAKALGVSVRDAPVHDDAGIERVMTALAKNGGGGVLAMGDVFTAVHNGTIVGLGRKLRVPTLLSVRQNVEDGGLMSYGVDLPDLFRRSADYVDRILRGDKPADLPVQRPDRLELAINLKTAKAIGVTIPTMLLATADEVVE